LGERIGNIWRKECMNECRLNDYDGDSELKPPLSL
jgi:hypothetical protein